MSAPILAVLFCAAAAIYSSAGFGGGSAYLALLALAAVPTHLAAVLALLCNLVVVVRTSWSAGLAREVDWNGIAGFAWISVPAAAIAASHRIEERHLELLLATSLFCSAIALASPKRAVEIDQVEPRTPLRRLVIGTLVGAPLGVLSGIIGIGGGVFLSPILHFARWSTSRRIATMCSVFILVNSLAGLLGKWSELASLPRMEGWWVLPIAVWLGGNLGTRLLLRQLSNVWITRSTALVVLAASLQTFLRVL